LNFTFQGRFGNVDLGSILLEITKYFVDFTSDKVSAIDLGFPHGFLDGNQYIYGATHYLIDNQRV